MSKSGFPILEAGAGEGAWDVDRNDAERVVQRLFKKQKVTTVLHRKRGGFEKERVGCKNTG